MKKDKFELGQVDTTEMVYRYNKRPIYDGIHPILTFYDGSEVIGKLWGKGGILSFEGKLQESARLFFDEVQKLQKQELDDGS